MNPLTEHQIQQMITNYLRYQGFYVMRLNSGRIPIGEGRSKRLIQLSESGTPDLMSFRTIHEKILTPISDHSIDRDRVQLYFWEIKRPGKKATVLQSAKMAELTEYGAVCHVVTSIEDVEHALAL